MDCMDTLDRWMTAFGISEEALGAMLVPQVGHQKVRKSRRGMLRWSLSHALQIAVLSRGAVAARDLLRAEERQALEAIEANCSIRCAA